MAESKAIDWAKVELYLKAGSPQKKIASSLGISEDTLRRRVLDKYGIEYAAFAATLQDTGHLLLEATQFQKAMSGNIQMLLWLGKVKLGQKEPDNISTLAAFQPAIDQSQRIMELEHENALLKEKNANEPKTE